MALIQLGTLYKTHSEQTIIFFLHCRRWRDIIKSLSAAGELEEFYVALAFFVALRGAKYHTIKKNPKTPRHLQLPQLMQRKK
jgi:hypothetical protein